MNVKLFSISEIYNNQMWFMLQKPHSGNFSIVRRTPAGDEIVEGVNCYRMNNDYLLIGIDSFTRFTSRHNLYFLSDENEEIINLQLFENIMNKYDAEVNNTDKGYFLFTDSVVIAPEDDWRCDNTSYGPLSYGIAEGIQEQLTVSFDQIVAYDPIFSVDGIAHLVYLHFKDDDVYRYSFVNTLELPICGATISEALKLITEWAIVSEEPFNNQQLISKDALEFLNKLDFDWSLVENQSDMYIAEFLKGNPKARLRPQNIEPLTKNLDLFIKKNISYHCLSSLISLYPEAWNLQQIIDAEEVSMDITHKQFVEGNFKLKVNNVIQDKQFVWNNINKAHHAVRFYMFYTIIENAIELHNKVKTTGTF